MILIKSRRWLYVLLALWATTILSLFGLFLSYERASAADYTEHLLPADAETVHWDYSSQTNSSL